MKPYNILYTDPVFEELKEVILSYVPAGMNLRFLAELSEEERHQHVAEADVFIVAVHPVTAEMLRSAKNLKFIQKTGIGVDNIDLQAAENHAIPVSNTPGGNAPGVAELTILLTLALYRKLVILNEATKQGRWEMWEHRPTSYEMFGKIHGFIGFGNIAKEVAKRSQAFGTSIVYYDKFRLQPEQERQLGASYLPFEEVLAQSDIVSLHLPLLPDTRNLIGDKELSLMKKTAVLINVARGHIVDEQALYECLADGRLLGAGIDVWAHEPIKPDNPLLTLPNVIATPHIGAGTRDTLGRVLQLAFDNVERISKGEQPLYRVK